jgi:hypothetical protein
MVPIVIGREVVEAFLTPTMFRALRGVGKLMPTTENKGRGN